MAWKPLNHCHFLSLSLNNLFLSCIFHSTIFVGKKLVICHFDWFVDFYYFSDLEDFKPYQRAGNELHYK